MKYWFLLLIIPIVVSAVLIWVLVKYIENIDGQDGDNIPRTAAGICFCLFLGLFGLALGLGIFPTKTYARKTFLRAWLNTFLIMLGVAVFFLITYSIFYSI